MKDKYYSVKFKIFRENSKVGCNMIVTLYGKFVKRLHYNYISQPYYA